MDLQLAVQIQQWQRPLDSCATCPEAHQKCLIAKQPASLRAALPCLCCFLSTFLLLLRGVSQKREVVKNWWTRPTNSTGWTKTRVKPLTKRDVHPQFWFGDYPIAVYIYIYIPFYSHVGDFTALSENRVPQKLMLCDPLLIKIAKKEDISHVLIFLDIVMDWTNK